MRRVWNVLTRGVLLGGVVLAGSCSEVRTDRAPAAIGTQRRAVQAWRQERILTAPTPTQLGMFGTSVAISGTTLLVGEPLEAVGTAKGRAHVFVRSGTNWAVQGSALEPSVAKADDDVGMAVAIDGDTAMVGAPGAESDDLPGSREKDSGVAYRYTRSGSTWTTSPLRIMFRQVETAGERFGESIALSGAIALIGGPKMPQALYPGDPNVGMGEVWAHFPSTSGGWSLAQLTALDRAAGDHFGHAVAVDGDVAVIGAPDDDHAGGVDAGAAYVFTRSGTTWTQRRKLTASDAGAGHQFGRAVAIRAGTILVGAPSQALSTGAVYVFTGAADTWTQRAKLTANDGEVSDNFGISVALEEGTAVVGANGVAPNPAIGYGAVYIFTGAGATWSQQPRLQASDGVSGIFYGTSVAIDGTTLAVGALGAEVAGQGLAGKVYTYRFVKPNGDACQTGDECDSSYCVDSTCCASACTTACLSCANASGTCTTPIPRYSPDSNAVPPCTGTSSCDGAGSCRLINGQGCDNASDCASGYCVDSFCCSEACSTACYGCNATGSCVPVAAGNTDTGCAAGTGICGQSCDGSGNCRFAIPATSCNEPQRCADGLLKLRDHCDGFGSCVVGANESCGGYACEDATQCLTTCTENGQCMASYNCQTGACVGDAPLGTLCGIDSQCNSDLCVDGVCCNAACTGTCESCALAGTVGYCTQAAVGTDPRNRCQAASGGHVACKGACTASGECAFPDVGTSCGLCSGCDGTGRCTVVPADDATCGTIDCSGLDTTCRSYQDLTANRCAALGACKTANDPATCAVYTDLPCEDAGTAQQDSGMAHGDGGGLPGGGDAGTTGNKSGGCRAAPGAGPAGGALALSMALSLVLRRRRLR